MVEHEQEDIPDFKAALATILVEQVLDDRLAVFTEQPNDSQKEQLRRAIGLFTEAWNSVVNTELRTLRDRLDYQQKHGIFPSWRSKGSNKGPQYGLGHRAIASRSTKK